MTGVVQSECHCCGRALELEVTSDLRARTLTPGAAPVISKPQVDFAKLKDPSIIDAF